MPTGYTAEIPKGLSFEEFVLGCANAFHRNTSEEEVEPAFDVLQYHKRQISQAKTRLSKIQKLTMDEANLRTTKKFQKEQVRIHRQVNKTKKLIGFYKKMLLRVVAWQPPTEDHVALKEFMISQLETSIDHDDMGEYYKNNPAVLMSGEAWLLSNIDTLTRTIQYHTIEYDKYKDRKEVRTKWIKELKNSMVCVKFGTDACDTCKKRFNCYTITNNNKVKC